jgi:hypothetical protein
MNTARCLAAITIACLVGTILFDKMKSGAGSQSVAISVLQSASAEETAADIHRPPATQKIQPNTPALEAVKENKRPLSLLEKFCAHPDQTLAQKLLIEVKFVTHLEDDDRIVVGRHERDWLTIFFQRGVEDEEWGVVTISPSGYTYYLRGDRCLWGADELDPIDLIWLEPSSTPVLTLLERDGGSGGYEETLRLFKLNGEAWSNSGSLPLSYAWRSGDFPELCGADTPYRQRKATMSVVGKEIKVSGAERRCRRLPGTKTLLKLEHQSSRFVESYAFVDGSVKKIRSHSSPLQREQQKIVISDQGAEFQSH